MHETQLVDEWSLRTVLSTADLFSIFCHFSACFIVLPPCLATPWPYSCLNINIKFCLLHLLILILIFMFCNSLLMIFSGNSSMITECHVALVEHAVCPPAGTALATDSCDTRYKPARLHPPPVPRAPCPGHVSAAAAVSGISAAFSAPQPGEPRHNL